MKFRSYRLRPCISDTGSVKHLYTPSRILQSRGTSRTQTMRRPRHEANTGDAAFGSEIWAACHRQEIRLGYGRAHFHTALREGCGARNAFPRQFKMATLAVRNKACVIMNWPERIKTQPHDDRDNCFLPFDSKGPLRYDSEQ